MGNDGFEFDHPFDRMYEHRQSGFLESAFRALEMRHLRLPLLLLMIYVVAVTLVVTVFAERHRRKSRDAKKNKRSAKSGGRLRDASGRQLSAVAALLADQPAID